MKIAFIGQKGIPSRSGGVEKHVEELAVGLAAKGHEVLVYTRPHYTDPKLTEYKGVKLISLPSLNTKNLDAITHTFLACLDLLRRKVDIVHFHSIGPSSLIWLARLVKPSAKIVATFHCQDYYHKKWSLFGRLYLKFGEWMACHAADKTITVSKQLKSYASNEYSVDAEYIPNGVPIADIKTVEAIKSLWGLEKESYILTVSRLVRHKGIHYLIEAYKNLVTDKKLVIAGEGAFTDDYVAELKQLAAGDKRIIFIGAQHGNVLKELLSNAYLFVQPSESEGLSIALLEAMSYAKASIVSDIPENMEAISDTGVTFNSQNALSLADKLNMLLNAPQLVTELGLAAQKRALKEYNWEMIIANTEQIYGALVTESLSNKLKRRSMATRFSTFL